VGQRVRDPSQCISRTGLFSFFGNSQSDFGMIANRFAFWA
jgi:hypothetical protein